RAAHTAALNLEQRLGIFNCFREELQRLISAFRFEALEGFIKDTLGRALLALPHHRVNELRHQVGTVDRIRLNRALWNMSFTRHITPGFKVAGFQSFKASGLDHGETLKPSKP